MSFKLTAPCDNCPFKRTNFVALPQWRVKEVANNMLSPSGKSFNCHKTTGAESGVPAKEEQHCAGALIFAEKHKIATQWMRIGERIRLYNYKLLDMGADVFDSLKEMLAAHKKFMGG